MTEIIVRNAVEDDIPAIVAIYSGKLAAAGTLQNPYVSAEAWRKRLSAIPENVYSLVAVVNNEVVGQIGFTAVQHARRNHVGSFGMAVKDECHGKGIGSELLNAVTELADNWLNLRRIELTVFTDNEPAIALYKKFGFVIEGEAREFAFLGGVYLDAYYMARVVDRS